MPNEEYVVELRVQVLVSAPSKAEAYRRAHSIEERGCLILVAKPSWLSDIEDMTVESLERY